MTFKHERHNCSNILALSVIVFRNERSKQQAEEEIHGRTTEKISTVLKEGVSMILKAVTNQQF